jgi:hypothetical protein
MLELTELLVTYLPTGAVGLVIAVLFRWGRKVDQALAAQNTATERLIERMDGHERLDDERYEVVRVLMEQSLASNGGYR